MECAVNQEMLEHSLRSVITEVSTAHDGSTYMEAEMKVSKEGHFSDILKGE